MFAPFFTSYKSRRKNLLDASVVLIQALIRLPEQGFKRNKHKWNLHYAAMLMMTSQILKSAGFTRTQKSRYLENETLFFLQIKKFINYTSSAAL